MIFEYSKFNSVSKVKHQENNKRYIKPILKSMYYCKFIMENVIRDQKCRIGIHCPGIRDHKPGIRINILPLRDHCMVRLYLFCWIKDHNF